MNHETNIKAGEKIKCRQINLSINNTYSLIFAISNPITSCQVGMSWGVWNSHPGAEHACCGGGAIMNTVARDLLDFTNH